jgi:hypothetical protein
MRPSASAATRLLLASLALLVLWPDAAAADSCLDQVRQMAERHGVATDPPVATPDRSTPNRSPGTNSQELGRSGGVIAPPQTEDRSVIAPPPSAGNRMPTMPDVTPTRPGTPSSTKDGDKEVASDRTTLQALLVAARAEAERGREDGCLDRLAKARELMQRSK